MSASARCTAGSRPGPSSVPRSRSTSLARYALRLSPRRRAERSTRLSSLSSMDTKTFVIALQDIRISCARLQRVTYWTTKMACPRAPPQVTSIGHVPRVVFPPIFQVQLTASEVLAVRPCAELGPLLYVTTMPQEIFGAVETAAKPVPLRDTGDRTEVKTTPTGFAVGAAVAGARVAGVCVTGACVAGAAACAAGTIPASRVAGLPHPAIANRATQIATENRFPKSHPSLSPTVGAGPTQARADYAASGFARVRGRSETNAKRESPRPRRNGTGREYL